MEEIPRVFLLDPEVLLAKRSAICEGDEALQAADERLLREADQALFAAPVSVVDKEALPPSGDPRDYMSEAPYWWPEAEGEQSGTYVWRDGEFNPQAEVFDRGRLGSMCSALSSLAPAYFFTDLEHFAEHAGLLLRTWFLEEATAMNPHLEYGQAIPGRCTGQGAGIIDTHCFSWLVEMVGLLGASSAWNEDDQSGLQAWFGAYLDWLLTSHHGREEAAQNNHHGTWYDVQVASLALFAGRDEVANEICRHSFPRRLAAQIEPDGRQPLELVRTRSLDYCLMNLTALFDLADLGGRVDIDLWAHKDAEGRSIRRAFYWLVEHAVDGKWGFDQATPFAHGQMMPLLRRGGVRFDDAKCEERIAAMENIEVAADRTNLLYPARSRT